MHIDDNEGDRSFFRESLAAVDIEVLLIEVASAEEAMKNIAQVLPDLIIVDCNMPGLNRLEFIRNIRQNPKFNATKIVLLNTPAEAQINAPEYGADNSYVKPATVEKFKVIINELLSLKW